MFRYLQFFFGTRVRAIASAVIFSVFGLVTYFRPDLISQMIAKSINAVLTGVFTAIEPLMEPLLVLIIMGIGFGIMTKPFRKSKGK